MATCDLETVMKGTTPVVTATFLNEDDVLTNPTTVRVITRDPSGDQLTYTTPNAAIVNTSVGVFEFTFPAALTEVGKWWVLVSGTAGVLVAQEISFTVKGTHVSV